MPTEGRPREAPRAPAETDPPDAPQPDAPAGAGSPGDRSHHDAGGGFVDPWGDHGDTRSFLRWRWERWTRPLPPDPAPGDVPTGTPEVARPRAPTGEVRATWIGHASFLLQLGGLNLLLDPVFSRRASPLSWVGPARFLPPGLGLDELPPIDAVVLSHDHYDHLDAPSVRALAERWPRATWFTPLGYRAWLEARGVRSVVELDWWESGRVQSPGAQAVAEEVGVRLTALPARHWCRRGPGTNTRLWAAWGLAAADGRRVYFCGDSGYAPHFERTAAHAGGAFDLLLLPVGAYEPRWFMRSAHMDPDEAVRAYVELGGEGVFVGMHWGTFRLTDEDPLEPPVRTRAAWARAGLPEERLRLPGVGGTVVLPSDAGGARGVSRRSRRTP